MFGCRRRSFSSEPSFQFARTLLEKPSTLPEIRKFMGTLIAIDVLFIEIYSINRRWERLNLVVNYSICADFCCKMLTLAVVTILISDIYCFWVSWLIFNQGIKFKIFLPILNRRHQHFRKRFHFLYLFQFAAHVWLLFPLPKTGRQLLRYLQQAVQWKTDNKCLLILLASFVVSGTCFIAMFYWKYPTAVRKHSTLLDKNILGMFATGLSFKQKRFFAILFISCPKIFHK